MLNVQGLVVPEHVVVPPPRKVPVQPVKVDPAFAVTVSVPVALLLRSWLHGFPVHVVGLGAGDPVTALKATEPPPVPANVMMKFLFAAT